MPGNDRVFSPNSRLDPLQEELLLAFFARERRFFLTGGAALAGFHLGHRATADLDLFTTDPDLERGTAALRVAVSEVGGAVETLQTAPTFRRHLVRRGDEAVVVDLVHELVPQLNDEKMAFGTVRVDSPEEIFANKLCALLSRAEIRDLVDVRALEAAGLSLDDALTAGSRKDGGLTPAQLGWVLSTLEIGKDAEPPGGVTAGELRSYLRDLVDRLTSAANGAVT